MKAELIKRATDIQERLQNGEFEHEDMVLYTIQLSAVRQHKKSLLKKNDFKDIKNRVMVRHPETRDPIPTETKIEELPASLYSFMKDSLNAAWKIEWMYRGGYVTSKSLIYKERFGSSPTSRKDVYAKICDTMGFSKWDVGLKMWIESMHTPGQIIKYEGVAYHWDTKKTKLQTCKMMTVVLDYQHVITMTLIC